MYLVIPLDDPNVSLSAPIGANLIPDEVDFIQLFTGMKIPQKWWTHLNLKLENFLLYKQ